LRDPFASAAYEAGGDAGRESVAKERSGDPHVRQSGDLAFEKSFVGVVHDGAPSIPCGMDDI
jgi:hypothetical protein